MRAHLQPNISLPLERFLFTFPAYFYFLRARRIDLHDVWGEEAKAKSVIAAPNTFNTIKFSSFGAIKVRKEWQTFWKEQNSTQALELFNRTDSLPLP